MTDRRDFLKHSSLLGFGAAVPTFLGNTALAAPTLGQPGAKDTILVVVQLTGGNDGLNTVIPFTDPLYTKYRPNIGIAKDKVLKLNDSLGLHPAMSDLAGLFNDNALSVIQGVGYPNPSQSHFRSMDVWQAASTADNLTEGWLGKALKQKTFNSFHLASSGTESAPLALSGAPARVPSLTTLEDFQLKSTAANAMEKREQKKLIESVSQPAQGGGNLLDFVKKTATTTYASSQRLQELAKNYTAKVTYPTTALATRLKLAAQLIDAGVGARLFYVSIDGFDTHAGQGGAIGSHANLLAEVSGAIGSFLKDVSAHGHKDRVCVLTFSEFGRRAKENGSNGTDHGSAAPMFLAGARLKTGVFGKHPNLEKLEEGNLVHAIDFRQVYAAVLKDWLGLDPVPVLGKEFAALQLFK